MTRRFPLTLSIIYEEEKEYHLSGKWLTDQWENVLHPIDVNNIFV